MSFPLPSPSPQGSPSRPSYDDAGPAWYWNSLTLGEHTGTHFDAPVQWVTGKEVPNGTTDTLDPSRSVGPAYVTDVRAEVAPDPNYLLTIDAPERWEEEHGRIPSGAWVLLHSGWSRRG